MSVLCSRKQQEILFCKGAPESIFSRCTSVLCNDDGSAAPMTAEIRAELEEKLYRYPDYVTPPFSWSCVNLKASPFFPRILFFELDRFWLWSWWFWLVCSYGEKETLRCLALALKPMPMGQQTLALDDEYNLTFVGLVACTTFLTFNALMWFFPCLKAHVADWTV